MHVCTPLATIGFSITEPSSIKYDKLSDGLIRVARFVLKFPNYPPEGHDIFGPNLGRILKSAHFRSDKSFFFKQTKLSNTLNRIYRARGGGGQKTHNIHFLL